MNNLIQEIHEQTMILLEIKQLFEDYQTALQSEYER